MPESFDAVLVAGGERFEIWHRIFETNIVPVLSPVPERNEGPDGVEEWYKLDTAALTPEIRARLVDYLVTKFKLDRDWVERSIDDPKHGVPIRAADVVVAIDARYFV